MPKLTKYTSFESMKAAAQPVATLSAKEKNRLTEFEWFLKMLRINFSGKTNSKPDYGK